MKGFNQPYWRNSHRCYYLNVAGKQVRLAPDKALAYAMWHQMMSQNEPPKGPELTLEEVVYKFLASLNVTRSPRTYTWYRDFLRFFVKHLGKNGAVNVKPSAITELVMSQKNWGPNTKHNAIRCLKRIYKWAKQNGVIDTNPIEHLERPPQEARETCVTPEQMATIEATLPDGPFKELLMLAWDTGMRPEELFRLEAGYVSKDGHQIDFPAKVGKGKRHRTVFVGTDRSVALLVGLIARHPDGKLLRNTKGLPWDKNSVNCAFMRLRKKLNFEVHLGALRKGFCTEALKAGVDTVTVAHLMGHADVTMVSRVYGKVAQDKSWMAEAARRAKRQATD